MRKHVIVFMTITVIALAQTGCDSGTQNTQVQDIAELKWQADGSAMYGFLQSYIETATSTIPGIGYNIVKFNTDGSLAQTYNTVPLGRPDFSTSIFVSADGSVAVTQLENDLYRYGLKTGVLEKLQQQFHLIVASPDLHYAAGSPSPVYQTIKTLDLYDITASPIRLVAHLPYVSGLAAFPGIWLSNGMFGVTCLDSVGARIFIYDTTGVIHDTIPGAETAFHNTVFNSQKNDLFVLNYASKTTDYFVDKINLTTKARSNILNFKVENFDVTKDEQAIIYSAYDSTSTISMKSRNLITQNVNSIATDILLIITLSPAEDKLAYIRKRDDNFSEVRVIPFNKP